MRLRTLGVPMMCMTVLACAVLVGLTSPAYAQSSPALTPWVDPLPVPPVATPTVKPLVSLLADYYEINMTASQHKFHRDLGPARVWTYGQPGKTPVMLGPTIVAKKDRPVIVKWINNLPTALDAFPLKDSIDPTISGAPGFDLTKGEVPPGAATPHLHGGHSAARFDGTPDQWFTADGKRGMDYVTDTFTYLNDQPASLIWYHDHTMGATRFKPYLGLAAAYVIFDKVDDGAKINGQNVPTGYGKYHLPIVLQDKQFNADGTLFYPTVGLPGSIHQQWVPEFFGDTPVVNGKAYPFLDAQPRRYRLRFLNGSQARFYNVGFRLDDGTALPFWVIGSEGGLLPKPVRKDTLLIAPGERFDAIVDFTGIPLGRTVMMTNDAPTPYPMGDPTNAALPELMKININTAVPATDPDISVLPASLKLPAIARLAATPNLPPRDVVLKENADTFDNPVEVLLNGYNFMDPVTDFVKAGTTETWQWINLTVDEHPMHPHLVAFQVVNRQPFDAVTYEADWTAYLASGRTTPKPNVNNYVTGPPVPPAPEEMGFKDTVKADPGYVTRVRATFNLPVTALLDYNAITRSFGSWVYHCHILEHEENDMMRPYVVVR